MNRNRLFSHAAFALLLLTLVPGPVLAVGGFNSCLGYSYDDGPIAGSGLDSTCIRPFSEGLAAVLLPRAGADIDDVAAASDGALHAWGFLDSKGELAIKPQFEYAHDFHNGYAAVVKDELWGFIAPDGNWAIQPSYPKLLRQFTAGGLALVVDKDGRYRIINTQGQVVSGDDIASAERVTLYGGQPSRVAIDYGTQYLDAQGRRVRLPAGVRVGTALGTAGDQLAYAEGAGAYGVLAADMSWAIEPRFNSVQPLDDGNAALVETAPDVYAILTAGGTLRDIGEGIRRGDFWLSRNNGNFNLYWHLGRLIDSFPLDSNARFYRLAPFLGVGTEDQLTIHARNAKAPLQFDAALQPLQLGNTPLLVLTDDGRNIAAVVTVNGAILDAAHGQPWVGRISSDSSYQAFRKTWLLDANRRLLQVIDRHGRPLLDASAIAQLTNHTVTPILPVPHDAPAAIAFVGQPHCNCGEQFSAGLLLSDGSVELHDNWYQISSMNPDWKPRYRTELEHLPANARFRVQTLDNQFGIIAANGEIVVEPTLDRLNDYEGGFVLNFDAGQPVILDRAGKRYPAPKLFQGRLVGDGLLAYTDSALVEAGHRLYDIQAGHDLDTVPFKHIDHFVDGRALALAMNGRYGVLNRQGLWAIKPQFKHLSRAGNGLWLAGLPKQDDADGTRSLLAADGQVIVHTDQYLAVDTLASGLTIVTQTAERYTDATHSWLLAAGGDVLREGDDIRFSRADDWIAVQRPTQVGFMIADGSWAMAPQSANIDVFHATSGLALRDNGGDQPDTLVDIHGNTVATLPAGRNWEWPLHAAGPLSIDLHGNDYTTRYADTHGKLVATVDGYGRGYADGLALISLGDYEDGPFTWADADGEPYTGIRFSVLGRPVGQRAVAGYGGGLGVIDTQGRFILPPVFLAISLSEAGIVAANDRESMLLDAHGRPIVRVVRRCNIRILYDAQRQPVWPEQMPQECEIAP